MPAENKPELMTVSDLVSEGFASRTSVYRMLKDGRMPLRPLRVGEHLRFSRRDFERFRDGELTEPDRGGKAA